MEDPSSVFIKRFYTTPLPSDLVLIFDGPQYHHPASGNYPTAPAEVVNALERHSMGEYVSGARTWRRDDSQEGIGFRYQEDQRSRLDFFLNPYFNFLAAKEGSTTQLDYSFFPALERRVDHYSRVGFLIPGTAYALGFCEKQNSREERRSVNITIFRSSLRCAIDFTEVGSVAHLVYVPATSGEKLPPFSEALKL